MTYAFACPIQGCTTIMTTEANSREEAIDDLTAQAKGHLETAHPEIQKTEQQVRDDVETGTVQGESNIPI
jgi:hypothetical protein